MARPISGKCRRCAKQPIEVVKEKECWDGQKCHVRRSNYKKRDSRNIQRRKKYRLNQGLTPEQAEVETAKGEKTVTQVITVPMPQSVGAIVHFYRQTKTAPLHAISAELWCNGEKIVAVEPVHTLGWTGTQVKQYMRDILRGFSTHTGTVVSGYESAVEHDPNLCSIPDCPLK